MRFIAQVFGVALALSGGLWILQGLSIVAWPEGSLIVGKREWALYGAITLALGAGLFVFSTRMGPPGSRH